MEMMETELEKTTKLYEGKAKELWSTSDDSLLISYFKDDITAGNGEKKDSMLRKGILNQNICTKIYEYLNECDLVTHFIRSASNREQVVKKLKIIPVEVIVRNFAAGSICKRYNLEKGYKFKTPLLELFYKDDSLNDPLVVKDLVIEMGWASAFELAEISRQAHVINQKMIYFWQQYGIQLVDQKFEFGIDNDSNIMLGDEITPDTQRLWNKDGESLDKDIFREGNNLDQVQSVYQYIFDLVCK